MNENNHTGSQNEYQLVQVKRGHILFLILLNDFLV